MFLGQLNDALVAEWCQFSGVLRGRVSRVFCVCAGPPGFTGRPGVVKWPWSSRFVWVPGMCACELGYGVSPCGVKSDRCGSFLLS